MSTRVKAGATPSRRAQRRMADEQARRRRLAFFGAAVVIAVAAAIVLIVVSSGGNGGSDLPSFVAAGPGIDSTIPAAGRVLGDPNAPVTVVEWGDYQCPACGMFAREIQPQLIADYVATGKVRFVYRDFAFLDQTLAIQGGAVTANGEGESVRAAEAAACAADQGKFWPYHDTLYANQHGENEGAFTEARLIDMARLSDLDTAAFQQCVDSRAHQAEVEQMFLERAQLGINSTPTFVVNGRVIQIGSYDDLKQAIDAALAG